MAKISTTFAERLTHYRKLRGLSQEDLAKRCGLSRNTVYGYEAGKGFSSDGLSRLASALDIEETDLVSTSEPPKPIEKQLTPADALAVLNRYFHTQEKTNLVPEDVAQHFEFVTNWTLVREVLRTIAPLKE